MILSVAITSKSGRALVARQFSYLTRTQIEGHLGAFPKLLSRTDQSYIDAENIRYVYQDLGDLYFILITSKDSNILEDLDLLSLLVDITRSQIQSTDSTKTISEASVLESSIELIFAYDELIFDGYRTNLTIGDVETFLKMESTEEDEFLRVRREKEAAAAAKLKEEMRRIEAARRKQTKTAPVAAPLPQSFVSAEPEPDYVPPARSQARSATAAGMVLGKKATPREKAQQMILEEGLTVAESPADIVQPLASGVSVRLDEFVDQVTTRTGLLKEFMIEGRAFGSSTQKGPFLVDVTKPADFAAKFKLFGIKQRDRQLFDRQNRLALNGEPGEETQLMGWRFTSTETDVLPISVQTSVSQEKRPAFWCEIEVKMPELQFAALVVTIPFRGSPEVTECSGEVDILARESVLRWTPKLGGDGNPDLEFRVDPCGEDAFYPVTVQFEAESLYCQFDVNAVTTPTGEAVPHRVIKRFSARRFQIT
jgi:hypothetical protein